MTISHVNTQTGTQANASSVSATKPTGTASGDLLIGIFTCNAQNATAPSGWAQIHDKTIETFRCQIFYKVAGGSEPSSYAFSVPDVAPLVLSISAFRNCDPTTPIDTEVLWETALTHTEPYTTLGASGGTQGRVLHVRTVRYVGSTVPTFTAGSGTELADVGVFSGGSVCYSIGFYMATSEYFTSGSQSGLAITTSQSESQNEIISWGIRALSVPGAMEVDLPLPTMTVDGNWSYPAVVDVDLPLPTVDVSAWAGNTEGTLEAPVPITMTLTGSINPTGTLDTIVLPTIELLGETRFFAENVVNVDREERWFIMTQDGYRLGIRAIRYTAMAVTLPLPEVTIAALQSEAEFGNAGATSVTATANAATAPRRPAAGAVTASVTANAATAPRRPAAGVASATVTANQPSTVKASFASAGHASATVTANSVSFAGSETADAGIATATATANQPTVLIGRLASAGHASVTCHN